MSSNIPTRSEIVALVERSKADIDFDQRFAKHLLLQVTSLKNRKFYRKSSLSRKERLRSNRLIQVLPFSELISFLILKASNLIFGEDTKRTNAKQISKIAASEAVRSFVSQPFLSKFSEVGKQEIANISVDEIAAYIEEEAFLGGSSKRLDRIISDAVNPKVCGVIADDILKRLTLND